jgi:hypothetical protein
MTAAEALAVAITFVWLGMVLAISFLEAPLKFRAPNVTLHIGLGIGRIVFRALNAFEAGLAVVLLIAIVVGSPTSSAKAALAAAIGILVVQLVAVRPRLSRRTDAVLAGRDDVPRSHAHHVYVVLEVLKVAALVVGGAMLFST